jgi:hypothetical protein
MLVGEAREGRIALAGIADLRRCGLCHFDDLGRSVHDDMTPGSGETFNPSAGSWGEHPRRARP